MAHTSLILPDGRSVQMAPETWARLSCGVLVFDAVRVFQNPAVTAATEDLGTRLRQKHAGLKPSQIPGLAEARNLYKSFAMEPTRYRPSSEALLRRVVAGPHLCGRRYGPGLGRHHGHRRLRCPPYDRGPRYFFRALHGLLRGA
ncbi:hypothetical protein CSA17_00655 [bacterium DOLJORAL78_65_58]|nr:MAG: hypothetical protein CSA17_00655 [bacterium DOLJORAL78_65_58]